MVKELTLRLPDEIYGFLDTIRSVFGISVTQKIKDYIARGLIQDRYVDIKLVANSNHSIEQKDIHKMSEDLKYCDGGSCGY